MTLNDFRLFVIFTIYTCITLSAANAQIWLGVYSDDPVIVKGDKITISGSVSRLNPEYNVPVIVQILYQGGLIHAEQIIPNLDGSFNFDVLTKGPFWHDGTYTVKAFYEKEVAETFFEVHSSIVKVPQPETATTETGIEEKPGVNLSHQETVEQPRTEQPEVTSTKTGDTPDLAAIMYIVITVIVIGMSVGIYWSIKTKPKKEIISPHAVTEHEIREALPKRTAPLTPQTDEPILQTGMQVSSEFKQDKKEADEVIWPISPETKNSVEYVKDIQAEKIEQPYTDDDYKKAIADSLEIKTLWALLHEPAKRSESRHKLYRSFNEEFDRRKQHEKACDTLAELKLITKGNLRYSHHGKNEYYNPILSDLGERLIREARRQKITTWKEFTEKFAGEFVQ